MHYGKPEILQSQIENRDRDPSGTKANYRFKFTLTKLSNVGLLITLLIQIIIKQIFISRIIYDKWLSHYGKQDDYNHK